MSYEEEVNIGHLENEEEVVKWLNTHGHGPGTAKENLDAWKESLRAKLEKKANEFRKVISTTPKRVPKDVSKAVSKKISKSLRKRLSKNR